MTIRKIDCFLLCNDVQEMLPMIAQIRQSVAVGEIFLLTTTMPDEANKPNGVKIILTQNVASTETVKLIINNAQAPYVLLSTKPQPVSIGYKALERMTSVADETQAALLYSDRMTESEGGITRHPTIDYQPGSLRDDFDFGQLLLLRTSLLKQYAMTPIATPYNYAGIYDLRLFLSRKGKVVRLGEYLYTERETDLRKSGEKQFDYVNPRNREVQIEMEQAATNHLAAIGATVNTMLAEKVNFEEQPFKVEASVIIPVYNREKTIAEAIRSALSQETDFDYNVIVVDNHSTDNTTNIIKQLVAQLEQEQHGSSNRSIIHLQPERRDLGIGGCWNLAINDSRCGRFAVQLDSDDLYSSPKTLSRIVEEFHKQGAAMVVGSYRMCDFDLNTLPPGLIDHREWTEENGPNNALRINGLGAPRAFFTPIVRQIQFPNTSYGEDYAMGIAISRRWLIGRIYDELYLCHRWSGNSDAALSVEKVNANNVYKDQLRSIEIEARQTRNKHIVNQGETNDLDRFFIRQLEVWPDARERYRQLGSVHQKTMPEGDTVLRVQWNPARIVSTGAKMDKQTVDNRPCFLCEKNRPECQIAMPTGNSLSLLVNPFPILPMHFTLPCDRHIPQAIYDNYGYIFDLLERFTDLLVFYNGPKCGASAPDHMHIQAGKGQRLPIQEEWPLLKGDLKTIEETRQGDTLSVMENYICKAFVINSHSRKGDVELFRRLYRALPDSDPEPMMNILSWMDEGEHVTIIIPRSKHRPQCYAAQDEKQMLVSPGAIDMGGLIITPREEDFEAITAEKAIEILREVGMTTEQFQQTISRLKGNNDNDSDQLLLEEEPEVRVGIVSAQHIKFRLNKPYMAKGEVIEGEESVECHEGAILWRGAEYRELTFYPQSPDSTFTLSDVTIGVNFHWERHEEQTFMGILRLVVEEGKICCINQLPVESYLESVISSEMNPACSLELMKAHAVISRSWLLYQLQKRRQADHSSTDNFFSFIKKDDELTRWYDREDHTIFDVCADDHCQRYQGVTQEQQERVTAAVRATRGQILMDGQEICDARFSKCCGGLSEEFEYCWENVHKRYLTSVRDSADRIQQPNLTCEEEVHKWITTSPDAYCNTRDKQILSQVLKDYDQETDAFYRWTVTYSQQELADIISEKLKMDFGEILQLEPLARGKSGRIWRLKIVGTRKTFTIGKELEIRRTLSKTHLLSSAFVVETGECVDGVPQSFTLRGAGWGHGVGLCQIGAAVMGCKGFSYHDILLHYYTEAQIKKAYK